MARLFKIMLRCPVTNQELDTGISTSGREVLSSDIYQDGTIRCPYCLEFHSIGANAYAEADSRPAPGSIWRPNP